MSHYITLPSDSSMKYYPDNTVAHYVTKLSERIHLDGEYEIGLAEIIIPYSWFNVDNQDKKYWFALSQAGVVFNKFYVKSGYYFNENEFINALTDQVGEAFVDVPGFSVAFAYDDKIGKVLASVVWKDTLFSVALSPALKRFLGFEGDWVTVPENFYKADRVFNLNDGLSLIYVYCDIAGYTIVGDTKAPLLRVCNVKGKYGDIVRITYERPHYVPLARRDFDTIEVNINNELGQPMPFEFGKSVVTLALRRRHEKTLLL